MAATASYAQSTVSIDGLVDAGYQMIDYKGTKVSAIGSNGSGTTALNFRGSEDLGGGLKANFRLETNFNMVSNRGNTGFINGVDTPAAGLSLENASANSGASTFGNGEIRVGVSGAFGAIDLGVPNNFTLSANMMGQPFGTAIGSGFRGLVRTDSGTMGASAVRFENAVRYTSPNINGLTAGVLLVQKNTKANSGTAATSNTPSTAFDFSTAIGAYDYAGIQELAVTYAKGPLNATFVNQVTNAIDVAGVTGAAGETKRTLQTISANYTMGALTGFATMQNFDAKTSAGVLANDTSYWALGARYVSGAHTLMAQTGEYKFKGTNSTTASVLALVGQKSDIFGLGYDYAMSKRTALYARHEMIDDKAGAITKVATLDVNATGKRTRTALGIRHTF